MVLYWQYRELYLFCCLFDTHKSPPGCSEDPYFQINASGLGHAPWSYNHHELTIEYSLK
jgi:hypothetical protein